MNEEWVSVKDDLPQLAKGRKRVSIDVNVLLTEDVIIENCFCTVDNGRFYDSHGTRIPDKKIKGWQTR